MNDPRRLLDGPMDSQGDLARSLLESGRGVAPPAAAKAQIWGNLQQLIGPPPGGGPGSTSPGPGPATPPTPPLGGPLAGPPPIQAAPAALAANAGGVALATKLGVAGLLAGGALFLATLATRPEPTLQVEIVETINPQPSDAPFTLPTPTAQDAPIERRALKEPATQARSATAAPVSDAKSAPVAINTAMREGEGVQRARAELAAGRPAAALAELRSLDRDVPRGTLGQERQVLAIEALAASGESASAARLASAFIEAHPTSPYADRLRRFAQ